MEIYMGIMMFVLGLCVGSFLNMAIFRLAKKYGLITKKQIPRNKQLPITKKQKTNENRSYCDYCGRQLFWYENVPIISWIIQGGRTRCCSNPLPWEYPIIEITTGVIFLQIYNFQIDNFQTMILYLVIASLLMFSLVFDLKYMILPDVSNLLLIVIAFYLNSQNVFVGLGSLLFFFLLNRIKIRGSEAMGMGDVKFSLFMGLFLGFPNILVAIYFAFVVGAVVSLILLALGTVKKEKPIPFGPFLIIGSVVAKIWGEIIINKFYGVLF